MKNGTYMHISAEDMDSYRDLARQYCKKSLQPLFEGEYSDGNLSLLPEKIETAFKIGLAASPEPSMPGNCYGIWGASVDEEGMKSSLHLLSIIAETCGGIAMSLHAQGVASNLVMQKGAEPVPAPVRVGLCLQEGFTPPHLGTILSPGRDEPARVMVTADKTADGYLIKGHKSFVYSMPDVDTYVVFARFGETWACFLVPSRSAGFSRNDAGVRTGLRACSLGHVDFRNVEVPRDARIDDGNALALVARAFCMNWAGMAAIAVGIARGAAAAARTYAAQRYQGGTQIEEHPAVKALIAGSEASIGAAESAVLSLSECSDFSLRTLGKAAAVKLAATELCARAVTDCLQTFGGYGYMEDFGMEKRLRDVTVLKSAAGSPLYLRQLIFDVEKEAAI